MENQEGISSKISATIQKSIQLIGEKIERVEQVDLERAEWMKTKMNHLQQGAKTQQLNAFEVLDEILNLQNELILFLDQEKNQETSLQVYVPPKQSFFSKVLEKFMPKREFSNSISQNTPMINQIAQKMQREDKQIDKSGFPEDIRKPVYDFLKDVHERGGWGVLRNKERIFLDNPENQNYIEYESASHHLYLNGEFTVFPTDEKCVNLLAFSELLYGKGENELKTEILGAIREVQFKERDIEKKRKEIKRILKNSEVYTRYKSCLSEAMEEFEQTGGDFYRRRDEEKNRWSKNVRNTLGVEGRRKIEQNPIKENQIPEDKMQENQIALKPEESGREDE